MSGSGLGSQASVNVAACAATLDVRQTRHKLADADQFVCGHGPRLRKRCAWPRSIELCGMTRLKSFQSFCALGSCERGVFCS